MIELQRLSPGDGIEIYDLLQSIPREENGDVDFPPRKWYYGHIKNVGGKRYFAPNK